MRLDTGSSHSKNKEKSVDVPKKQRKKKGGIIMVAATKKQKVVAWR